MAVNRAVSSHPLLEQQAFQNVLPVGMAQDLVKSGVELPALMTRGRWKSAKLPARYTERQAAGRGAVARYYQESGGQTAAVSVPAGETRDSAGEDLQELSATLERAGYRLPEQPTSLGSRETPIKRDC